MAYNVRWGQCLPDGCCHRAMMTYPIERIRAGRPNEFRAAEAARI